ncbi:MAG: hypothetical protein SCH98_11980 [Deferrisomatales bacterium]|nr:hypothetical protein [Deferrisomatales bacterium]
MPRQRDPKWFLERARQMEEQARKLREQGDRLRREREAKEDQRAGEALRRFWKKGWAGVALDDVVEAAHVYFGEPTWGPGGVRAGTDSGTEVDDAGGKLKTRHPAGAGGVAGDLFSDRGERSHAGS